MIRITRRLPTFFVGMVMILWPVVPVMANESLYSYLTGGGSGISTLNLGHTEFYSLSTDGKGRLLEATVDYAIFAPGVYSGANLNFSPLTVIGGAGSVLADTDYVYAYQIHNTGNLRISSFTMPRVSQIDISEYNFGYSDPDPVVGVFSGDMKPTYIYIEGSVIQISFLTVLLPPGNSSYVILIACPYYGGVSKPTTIANGGLADEENMPVPAVVPIPGALTLAAMGLGTIFVGRLRRRFL